MKPEWADDWVEEDFDYGLERGFMARVGPLKNAVRSPKTECVKPAVVSDVDYTRILVERMDDDGNYYTAEEFRPKVIKAAKYKDLDSEDMRSEAEQFLYDWFVEKAKDAKEFLARWEENDEAGSKA